MTTPDGMSYRQQVGAINCISYSTQTTLHKCPRKFLLEKLTAGDSSDRTDNIDFLYGHAVGAGIQNFLLTRDVNAAMWDSFLSWRGDLDIALEKKKKSFIYSLVAVQKFAEGAAELLDGWELAKLENGKPAIEVAFSLDLENGYIYLGHIDAILFSPEEQQFMVLELKTTGFNMVNEASFKNSPQALGYSLMVDAISRQLGIESINYSVLYLIYKAGMLEFDVMPFFKTKSQRAAWLLQLRMDAQIIDFYREVDHFPTHGESCYDFFRQCEYFGTCELLSLIEELQKKEGAVRIADAGEKVAGVDYYFKASELGDIVVG